MSSTPPDPDQPLAAEAECDPAVLRAEWRLRVLEETTEIGLRLMRALERRVLAEDEAGETETAEAGKAKGLDPAGAFAQLSRSVRLTLTLHGKTDEALRALKAGVVQERREAAERRRADAIEKSSQRMVRIHGLIMEGADAELREDADWERLEVQLEERLVIDETFWSDPDRPLREIVERYCRYFSLSPDWSRWDGEDWAPPEPPDPATWPWVAARNAAANGPSPPAHNGAAAHPLE